MKDAIVKCGACRACCRGEAVVLHPEHGDDVSSYETQPMPLPGLGGGGLLEKLAVAIGSSSRLLLKQKTNGDCIYLSDDAGCTIHARRPAMCRVFDCGGLVKRMLQIMSLKDVEAMAARDDVIASGLGRALPRCSGLPPAIAAPSRPTRNAEVQDLSQSRTQE